MADSSENGKDAGDNAIRSGIRFDLMIAVLALLISGIAAGASAYQTYVIRQQFSATVWPYLTFVTSFSTDHYVSIDLKNAGIGPALIRSVVVSRDGKPIVVPMTSLIPALRVAIKPDIVAADHDQITARSKEDATSTTSSITRGDVLSAATTDRLLRVEGTFLTRRTLADISHIDIKLCYCSLLGSCWTRRLRDTSLEPHAAASCPV